METPKYSEQDIQDYASGNYVGDVSAFEAYLQNNPAALAQVKQYQELYNLIQIEPIPSLSFNLADTVISKTHQHKLAPEPKAMRMLPYAAVLLGVLALLITLKYLSLDLLLSFSIDFNLIAVSAIIMIVFLVGFYHVEIKRRQESFAV